MMKIATTFFFENLLQDSLHDAYSGMPFLWQVIYQEANRANHLIFDRDDIEKFELQSSHARPVPTNRLSELMTKLLSYNEIDKIKHTIQGLPFNERKQIFAIYLRFIERWRYQFKQALN